jgi:hypothetical protein
MTATITVLRYDQVQEGLQNVRQFLRCRAISRGEARRKFAIP